MSRLGGFLVSWVMAVTGAQAAAQKPQTTEVVPGSVSMAAPLSLTASDGTGLRIVAFEARAVVEPPLAFTELRLTFRNPEARLLEGRFEITLPPGASISRFAMRQDSGWQEGEVVELRAARAAYEDFLHRRQDPALLEKQAGNQFQARVFPIPAGGEKELILSYSQELRDSQAPFRIHLRGLPELDRLDIRAQVGQQKRSPGGSSLGGSSYSRDIVSVQKTGFVPDRDFEVALTGRAAVALRHDNLVVARLRPLVSGRLDPLRSLFVLFDTSASRALGFEGQVKRLAALLEALREVAGSSLQVGLAAFDQSVETIYEGKLGDLRPVHLARLLERRALGASDLSLALSYLASGRGPKYERVLLVSDGIATAGAVKGEVLRAGVRKLHRRGVLRLDALVDGGLRDESTLRGLVTAGLHRHGIVAEASLAPAVLVRKLQRATFSGVTVSVPKARWVWPRTLDGAQSGDEVLVYADLPEGERLFVELSRPTRTRRMVPVREAERSLLERAWVGARIQKLLHERDTFAAKDPDLREAMRRQVIALSTQHRVLSDFTGLLVLETEADYARFHLERRALSDILTVGAAGLEVLNRKRADHVPVVTSSRSGPDEGETSDVATLKAPGTPTHGSAAPRLVAEPPRPDRRDRASAPPQALQTLGSSGAGESAMRSDSVAHGHGSLRLDSMAQGRVALRSADQRSESLRAHRSMRERHSVHERRRRPRPHRPPPPRVEVAPYSGRFAEIMVALRAGQRDEALRAARAWREEAPGDVLALIALGEALEARGELDEAARAYGSIIDLFPARADLRRFAGARLERLLGAGLHLAVDTFARAVAQRADHPASHRLLAYALLRSGQHARAFAAIRKGAARRYPEGRFAGVERILREDVGLIAAAWLAHEPSRRSAILAAVAKAGATVPGKPSLRFVLNWETDANDVDFHITDGQEGHASFQNMKLPSGGELYADVTTGYGPECFTIEGAPRAYPYALRAHYYSRGPMGYGMGKLQLIEHDGEGGLRFEDRPFVVMNDGAYVELGVVTGPLARKAVGTPVARGR